MDALSPNRPRPHSLTFGVMAKSCAPLAVALRCMLAETQAKLASSAPAEEERLRERPEVLREWITPKTTKPFLT
jgi:hypothetical protein